MVYCDDRLKHDRLLTLIRLFGYRDIGTRVVLVHDNNKHMYLQGPITYLYSHIVQFKNAYFAIIHDKNILA